MIPIRVKGCRRYNISVAIKWTVCDTKSPLYGNRVGIILFLFFSFPYSNLSIHISAWETATILRKIYTAISSLDAYIYTFTFRDDI